MSRRNKDCSQYAANDASYISRRKRIKGSLGNSCRELRVPMGS